MYIILPFNTYDHLPGLIPDCDDDVMDEGVSSSLSESEELEIEPESEGLDLEAFVTVFLALVCLTGAGEDSESEELNESLEDIVCSW